MIRKLKKIKNDIPNKVREYASANCIARVQYVSYLEKYNDEVLQRVFAYKQLKGKELSITEVLRRLSGQENYLIKNIYFTKLSGYQAVFEPKTVRKTYYGYYYNYNYFEDESFDKWYEESGDYYKVGYDIINPELLQETKFKYCNFQGQEYLIDYLNTYIKYPNVELLSKLGISPSKTLLQKAMKDKQFCNYLKQNREDIIKYKSSATLMAYKNKISIEEAYNIINISRELGKEIPEIRDTKIDRVKLSHYLIEKNIAFSLYNDYLMAIKLLNLNLEDTKNIYPREFMRMHDLRIQEYEAAKVEADLKEKANLDKRFKKVAEEFSFLNFNGKYIVVIAKEIKDLIYEGTELHHCVGKMGYDKKMVDKKSLIMFIREITNKDKPFVTMEYSLKSKKILQIYGDHDSKPCNEVLDFVNNVWLKFANKQLKAAV